MASFRKRGKVWYYRFVDAEGVKRERKGSSDRRVTEELARNVESEVAKIKAGLINPKALRVAEANRQPIQHHVDAFVASMTQAGDKPKHVNNTRLVVNRVLSLAKIERLSDLTPSAIVSAIAKLKDQGFAPRTVESYVIAVKSFSRWLWRDGRMTDYALVGLSKPKVQDWERRRKRRSLSDTELRILIETTKTAPSWKGLTGLDRSMLFAIASMTGFRRRELMSLTPEGFRLDATPPMIVCESAYTKNYQLAEQPIPDTLASVLRPWLTTKSPSRPVFEGMTNWAATGDMLRVDLERCGIPFKDESGRVVDLHALRHTYITALGRAGLPIKVHQTLARHSDPKLTLNVYTHLSVHDTTKAVESLPDLFQASPQAQALAATGTDPSINDPLAHYLPTEGDGNSRAQTDSDVIARSIVSESINVSLGKTDGSDASSRNESHDVSTRKASPAYPLAPTASRQAPGGSCRAIARG
jgi:site-specific recombinase XerD